MGISAHIPAPTLLVALLLASCSTPVGDPGVHRFESASEDGVQLALNRGAPRYEGELFVYEHFLTMQELEGEPDSHLITPYWLVRGPSGDYFVSDFIAAKVVHFDSGGRFMKQIGRKGNGPGEFGAPRIVHAREGIISVFDDMKRVEIRYSTDGTLVEVNTPPSDSFIPGYSESREMRVPRAYERVAADRFVLLAQMESRGEERTRWYYARVVDRAGRTVAEVSSDRFHHLEPASDGSWAPIVHAPEPEIVYSPIHGICVTAGDRAEIRIHRLDGTLERIIRWEQEPSPLTHEMRQEYLDRMRMVAEGYDGTRRQQALDRIGDTRFAEYLPFWTRLYVDEDGYFWLRMPQNIPYGFEGGKPTGFRVFSPEGEYVGVSYKPGAFISNGYCMASEPVEETGGRALRVYRMQSNHKGFIYP